MFCESPGRGGSDAGLKRSSVWDVTWISFLPSLFFFFPVLLLASRTCGAGMPRMLAAHGSIREEPCGFRGAAVGQLVPIPRGDPANG